MALGYKKINTDEMTCVTYKQRNMLEISQKELSIIEHGLVSGLMNAKWTSPYEMQFFAPRSVILKKYLSSDDINNAITVLRNTLNVIKEVDNNCMNSNHLLLDLEYVFVSCTSGDLLYIYEPYKKRRTNTVFKDFSLDVFKLIRFKNDGYGDEINSYKNFVLQHNDIDEINDYLQSMQMRICGLDRKNSDNRNDNYVIYESVEPSNYKNIAKLIRKSNQEITILSNGENRIGRMNDNTFVISDNKKVSRYHAVISLKDDTYFLKDIGSKNGTFLNDMILPVKVDMKITSGDFISFGGEVYQFIVE